MGPQPNDRQAFVYAYDANGNRVNLNWPGPLGPNTQGMDYTYDREGRLIGAQAYQTNGQGHRVDREVTRSGFFEVINNWPLSWPEIVRNWHKIWRPECE